MGNFSTKEMEIHPSNPNKYICFDDAYFDKSPDSGYYTCGFNDFKTVYFNWQLSQKKDEVIVEIPKYIPSFLREKYLTYKLGKPSYVKYGNPVKYRDSDHYKSEWDELIKNGVCNIK